MSDICYECLNTEQVPIACLLLLMTDFLLNCFVLGDNEKVFPVEIPRDKNVGILKDEIKKKKGQFLNGHSGSFRSGNTSQTILAFLSCCRNFVKSSSPSSRIRTYLYFFSDWALNPETNTVGMFIQQVLWYSFRSVQCFLRPKPGVGAISPVIRSSVVSIRYVGRNSNCLPLTI